MYRNLLATRTNYVFPVVHRISISVHQAKYKSKGDSQLTPDQATNESHFINLLHKKLNWSKEQAMNLCVAYPELIGKKLSHATKNLELLLDEGVRSDVILDNPAVLTLNHSETGPNDNNRRCVLT